MKFRFFFLALLGLAAFSALGGQEDAAPGDDSGSDLFPLGLLLDAAVSGESPWRPDWPAAMPPDGFTLATGQATALTLILPAGYLDAASGNDTSGDASSGADTEGTTEDGEADAAVEYRLVRDGAGRFLEFPCFINGAVYQGTAEYKDTTAGKIALDDPAAPPPGETPEHSLWEFEVLEYRQEDPVLARINHNGTWYFVAPLRQETRTHDTWYDTEGRAQGFFSLEYRLEDGAKRLVSTENRSDQTEAVLTYRYHSAGRISAIGAPEGEYTALYNAEARPRYWERPEGSYTLQWDEQGFLVRLTGVLQDKTGADAETQQLDIRYEYTLDQRGNWIERRETSFVRRFDRLVPDSNAAIYRVINYGDS
jgi:hypothetical protein